MTPTAESVPSAPSPAARAARRGFLGRCLAGVVLVLVAGAWVIVPPTLVEDPPRMVAAKPVGGVSTPPPGAVPGLALWSGMGEAPVARAAAPPSVSLFSIMRQGDTPIAALDFKEKGGLQYARAGETVNGVQVKSVDERGVELVINGASTRLELGQ